MEQITEYKEDMDIRTISARDRLTLLLTRSSCMPFSVIVVFLFFTQITGTSSVMIWAVEMLTKSNSSIDPHTGNFLMNLTRLAAITLTSILLFRVGRRPLALISALGVAAVCFAIAMYIYTPKGPSLVPLILFMSYMVFASFGYFSLPFLMAAELFPLQNRGLLGGITTTIGSLFIFVSLKTTPYLLDNIGLAYTMVIFGISSLLGLMFLYMFLPETKNLTLQEIEAYYSSLSPTLVSQRENITIHEAQSNISNKLQDNAKKTKTAPSTADVIDLAKTIYKIDAKEKPGRPRQHKKSPAVHKDNADNQDVPRPSVDSVLLQKIQSLARTVKGRRKKGSKENTETLDNSNGTPTEPPLAIGESKLEDISEDQKPGTSKDLEKTSNRKNQSNDSSDSEISYRYKKETREKKTDPK
ncbi:facilitated trehalose transporter Tret1-like [Spodoptera frugiperda]|uniref:Facilitated trehalose transporter Tret1-like n=1 Tax=Spodoptera frugiperda TaxID=7108 RepID=A0A9R0CTD7_SPOFR|nr:facilitated trehalose transporter Tret1-like [Spodoptera frugiperda]